MPIFDIAAACRRVQIAAIDVAYVWHFDWWLIQSILIGFYNTPALESTSNEGKVVLLKKSNMMEW